MVQPAHSRLKSLTGRIATYTVLLIWSGVCVFPIYWFGITSIKNFNDIAKGPRYLPFVDFEPTLAAWSFVFTDHQDNLRLGYMNSIIVASASTLLTLTFGAMAVYGLTRLRPTIPWSAVALLGFGLSLGAIILFERAAWPWCFAVFALASIFFIAMRGWARGPMLEPHLIAFGLIASRILPPVAMIAPLYVMAEMTGLLDTQLLLILVYAAANLPAAIWLLQPAFGTRATEAEEAAYLDGASHPSILFTILLPMIRQPVLAVGLLIFLLSANEYFLAAHLAPGKAITMPPWLVSQISMREAQIVAEEDELSHLSAAIVLMVLPLLAFSITLQRFLGNRALWQR